MINIKRKMIAYLGLALMLLGTAVTSYVTIKYRNNAEDKRKKIETLSNENNLLNRENIGISKRNEELNNRITRLSEENNKLVKKTNVLSEENKELNIDIKGLSNRISEQSKIIENIMTGGDSYAVLGVYGRSFTISTVGDYPLKKVKLIITDVGLLKKYQDYIKNKGLHLVNDSKIVLEILSQAEIFRNYYEILDYKNGSLVLPIEVPNMKVGQTKTYKFNTESSNGRVGGLLFLYQTKNGLRRVIKIELENGKFYEAPENYPKLEGDDYEPAWDKIID